MEAETKSSSWDFLYKGAVPYVDKWFLMGSPFPMLLILTSYLFFVLRCGPSFMESRPAYKLRTILLVYNAVQVAGSAYIVFIVSNILLEYGMIENGRCSMNIEDARSRILNVHHVYLMVKLTELLDTIFFVLRKKWSQVTFLHVYHHSLVFTATWAVLKYEPTYSLAFLGLINCAVHVTMYAYYGLSAIPKLSKYLWWKKYITKMQLIQFVLAFIHVSWNWHVTTCPTSYLLVSIIGSHLILYLYLFGKFYVKSYIEKKTLHNTKDAIEKKNNNFTSSTFKERQSYNSIDKSR